MLANLDIYIGPAAGVATSMLWTGTSLLFTAAAKRVGATTVNIFRITLAVVLLGITHRLMAGAWIPNLVGGQVLLLALSGVVGLSIGDQALFTSFVHLGPRLAMLIMATSPIFAALFAWLTLGETLHGIAWLGVGLTVGGVAWVVLERTEDKVVADHLRRVQGVILALIGSACQGGGLLLSKQGMGHGWLPAAQHLDAQAATLVRMSFAWIGMIPIVVLHGLRQRKRRASGIPPRAIGSLRAGLVFTSFGAVVGPYLGVWMSLVAADRAPVGVAQTLCSLTPVFLLPFAVVIHKERISPRAVVGAVIAVAGTALLFFKPW
ncbi:MAG: DMT family transporter [Phycisphaerae bacterium]|nr:DMT family transporter [Phycisphaerae bacterium]